MISQRLRSPGILDATPYLHAGYRCCAACAFAHLYTSFPNWRRGETCAKDNNLYPVWSDDTIWKMLGQLCQGRKSAHRSPKFTPLKLGHAPTLRRTQDEPSGWTRSTSGLSHRSRWRSNPGTLWLIARRPVERQTRLEMGHRLIRQTK